MLAFKPVSSLAKCTKINLTLFLLYFLFGLCNSSIFSAFLKWFSLLMHLWRYFLLTVCWLQWTRYQILLLNIVWNVNFTDWAQIFFRFKSKDFLICCRSWPKKKVVERWKGWWGHIHVCNKTLIYLQISIISMLINCLNHFSMRIQNSSVSQNTVLYGG